MGEDVFDSTDPGQHNNVIGHHQHVDDAIDTEFLLYGRDKVGLSFAVRNPPPATLMD